MITPVPNLPPVSPEIWSHIFSSCREPRDLSGKFLPQPTLSALVRVSSTFYHAATPHLYEHISAHDLSSLFWGTRRPTASLIPETSLATKNHLLRYVKSLHILLPPPIASTLPPVVSDGSELSTDPPYEELEHRFRAFHALIRHLDNLVEPPKLIPAYRGPPSSSTSNPNVSSSASRQPPALFPSLRHVQLGPNERLSGMAAYDWTREVFVRLAPSLSRLYDRTANITHCEHPSADILGYASTVDASNVINQLLPSTYIMHTPRQEGWTILWGTRNVVYIDKAEQWDPVFEETVEFVEEMVYLIQEAIEGSQPSIMSRPRRGRVVKDNTESIDNTATRAREKTTLTVYGLVRLQHRDDALRGNSLSILFGEQVVEAEEGEEAEIEAAAIREVRQKEQALMDQIQEGLRDWLDVYGEERPIDSDNVVLKGSWEAAPCPCCGRDCEPLGNGETAVEELENS